jgi:NAD(P)-dependent dehydrogenase (short-subunit alcohol dehydrogenase family)
METERGTAIVTGAAKRVGAVVAKALAADGWSIVAHVHDAGDEVGEGMTKVVADLAESDCAERIFAAATGLPPVRLLVNNAARFAGDSVDNFSAGEFDAHMAVNLRAPALLTRAFAERCGGDGLIVNLLDAKPGQSAANFAAAHAHNPLGRGVEPDDVVAALRYLVAAKAVTGEVLTIDGGQRFWSLERDVQFLSPSGDGQFLSPSGDGQFQELP